MNHLVGNQSRRHGDQSPSLSAWRFYLVVTLIIAVFIGLVVRAAYLQVYSSEDLNRRSDNRTVRTKADDVERGMIVDRNGIELAVSVPVQAIWADPKVIAQYLDKTGIKLHQDRRWQALADVLHIKRSTLFKRVRKDPNRRFVYLKRQVEPAMADYVNALKIKGVYQRKESKRYYPNGEISAHLVGFTNLDAQGIDGIEKLFNQNLVGTNGRRKIRKDASNREIEVLEKVAAIAPQSVTLSIDHRIQAVAYKALKKAVTSHDATSGSAIVVDVKTGEVLALVNSPSYNPNNRTGVQRHRFRNRAVTDVYEPGSILKPVAVISALEFGSYKVDDLIDTAPGYLRVGRARVRDERNYGELTMRGILQNSSNVGVAKLALSIPTEHLLDMFYHLGFGSQTGIGLIGESEGLFGDKASWSDFELATLSFGYSLSVTTVQLARMYSILGNDGIRLPLSILKQTQAVEGERVISTQTARQVLAMLESVVEDEGTGRKARVPGYRISGKTGTARIAGKGGYGSNYVGSFGGVAPVADPQLAVVVLVNDPAGDYFYGNDVAGPAFSTIMGNSLRILNIAPDRQQFDHTVLAARAGGTP